MKVNGVNLTRHAAKRFLERNRSKNDKWYKKEDLLFNCALYKHLCYVTRKSPQMSCITNGEIEILYNNETNIGITVLEVKDKFKPISKYFKEGV